MRLKGKSFSPWTRGRETGGNTEQIFFPQHGKTLGGEAVGRHRQEGARCGQQSEGSTGVGDEESAPEGPCMSC